VYPSVSAAVNRRGGETDLSALQAFAHSWLGLWLGLPSTASHALAHEPEKRVTVFRKDHAQTKR